ncbi:MAG TPA: PLP-dependent aminotransferase family protein [Candidatus Limnocylindrales bacterium]|nr:PLP-dependent aminotransferase family protein [Candidatus Limnocylindrales bacterium]
MSTALSQPRLISLAAGFTDQVTLPVEETRAIMEELLGSAKSGSVTLQYGTTLGDPILRELTASRLQLLDGNTALSSIATAERMIITNGSQQLLYMVTEALCDPGDIVLVEDPSYFVYLGILQSHGVRTKGVRMQPDGLDLAHLEELLTTLQREKQLHRLKLLYLVSYYQNPTGLTTSFEKKIGALKLLRRFERAAGHTLYLLEDAAYRELRFRGEDVKSALAIPYASERVIYTGTYSKPFATGARVGFGLLPKTVFTPVLRIKGNHDFGSSNLLQQLLARALGSDLYERHLAVLRNRYAQKAKVTRKALQQHFPPSVRWREPEGGLYFWPRLPHPLTSGTRSRFFHEALRKEVLFVPGELCYADDRARRKPNNEMRLSFGAASEGNLRAGIERLGQVLQKLLR